MANIFTNLNLTADSNFFITQKINSIGYVGENTVTRLNIEVPEITEGAVYELETENSAGVKNVALLSVNAENNNLYLDFTARMLTVNDLIMMQLRVTYTDNSIKKSNRFAMKIAKSISATDYYEEYTVSIFDQLVNECRDIIEGAESYAVRAETAAVNAEAHEQSASASAATASTASETAQTASTAAVNAATSAESASAAAHTSAETATTAANSASASEATAQTSAQTAQTASETAVNASIVATSAQTAAETAASTAATAASNASASATSASTSASNAATSETNASASATNAATSETNAANSASSASTAASNASTSATNAANSATSAATSATNAHTSEVNASASETNASTSATEAAASAESIAASVAQINENTYRINDLEAIIGGYTLTDLPTGAVASVTDGTALLMPSLKVGIEPVQDLHGYDHPWAGGAGRNLFNMGSKVNGNFANMTVVSDDNYITFNGTKYGQNTGIFSPLQFSLEAGTYYAKVFAISGTAEVLPSIRVYKKAEGSYATGDLFNAKKSFTLDVETILNIAFTFPTDNKVYSNYKLGVVISKTANIDKFYPYSNICPISGWNEANIAVSPTTDAEDGTTYTIQFKDGDNPLVIYGGTLNAISGLLTVTDAYISSYNAETLPSTWISDRDVYAEGATPTTGAEVVYKLANSVTYQLTPTQIRTLVGTNNIWADTGNIIEGKYYKSLT